MLMVCDSDREPVAVTLSERVVLAPFETVTGLADRGL